MADQFTVPEEFDVSFRRIMPYLAAPLQNNLQILNSLVLYLKLGGEKMARIAIDAMNVTQRLKDAEVKRQLREQELLYGERQEALEDEEEEGDEDQHQDQDQNEIDEPADNDFDDDDSE